MSLSEKPYVIVVGIDYSELSRLALLQAFQTATERTPSEVHVLHVRADEHGYPHAEHAESAPKDEALVRALERLQHLVRTDLALFLETGQRAGLRPLGLVSHIRSGSAAREIAQLANDLQANLVVVGTQGRTGIARLLLGSVAHAVVTLAPCAVLVARDRSFALSVPARGRPGDLDGTETRVQVGSEGN